MRRWTFIVLAVLAVAVAAVALLLPRIVDLNKYRAPITARIEQATGGEASVGSISWGIANGLRLQVEGLTLRNAAVLPGDIELPRIDATLSVLPLLKEELVVQELRLERPVLAWFRVSRPRPRKSVSASKVCSSGIHTTTTNPTFATRPVQEA